VCVYVCVCGTKAQGNGLSTSDGDRRAHNFTLQGKSESVGLLSWVK
jgi:hypothetical protein